MVFELEIDNMTEFCAFGFVLEIFVSGDCEDLVVYWEALVDEIEFAGGGGRLDAVLVAAFPVDVAASAYFDRPRSKSILVLWVEVNLEVF